MSGKMIEAGIVSETSDITPSGDLQKGLLFLIIKSKVKSPF